MSQSQPRLLSQLRFLGSLAILIAIYHLTYSTLVSSSRVRQILRSQTPRFVHGEVEPHKMRFSHPWQPPLGCNLRANDPAAKLLASVKPEKTTLHFTFGSVSMLTFMHNWHYFLSKAAIWPALVGAADAQMLAACTNENVPSLGIAEGA